jgi:hypothetical protein
LPDTSATRFEIQRVATHILARARKQADDEISLRVGLTGISTPAYGDHREVLRLAGTLLVHETPIEGAIRSRVRPVLGATLLQLAELAGVDLDLELDFGADAPPIGDRRQAIVYDEEAARSLLHWYQVGAAALDQILGITSAPSVVQLWPEHFDVAIDADTPSGRVNLGASPADAACAQSYLYVGPHSDARPGDESFWNTPFGAVLTSDSVLSSADPVAAGVDFFSRGLRLFS